MITNTLIIDKKLPAFKLRGWIMEQLFRWSYPVYGAIFKRRQKGWCRTKQQLGDSPPGSLGKEVYYFLNSQDFEILPKFEDHDTLHVLLGYSTHVVDEVRMQFCLLGNGKRSIYLYGVVCIGWLAFPECWHLFTEAIKRGRAMMPVHRWKFEHLLREPLFLLRNAMKGLPSEDVPLFI